MADFQLQKLSAYYQGAIPCKGLSIPMIYDSELSSATKGVDINTKTGHFNSHRTISSPIRKAITIPSRTVSSEHKGLLVKNAWNRVMLKINFRFGKGKQYQEPVREAVERDYRNFLWLILA